MRLAQLLFFLVLPAIIWNTPLHSNKPPSSPKKLSPWDLLTYENLTYDNISTLVMNLMYEDNSVLDSLWSVDDAANFIAYLARQGLPSWDTESQSELERDIAWLLNDDDYSDLENEPYWLFSMQTNTSFPPLLALNTSSKPQVLLCKSWFGKKWDKTKRFTKKHAKTIIIATAVITVGTAVILLTKGAAAPAVAAAATSAFDNNREPVNKPGEVRFKDDPPPQTSEAPQSNPPITYTPTPEPLPILTKEEKLAFKESFQDQKENLKETLSKELSAEPLNIPAQDHPANSQSLFDKAKAKGSEFAHKLTETVSAAKKRHQY